MGYKLEITQKASEHLDQLLAYLLNPLKSDQAAKHLLSGIEEIYDRLEEDPWQFPACIDYVLRKRNTGRQKYRAWHSL